ncbi:MAG: DUF2067 family protein [Sulfolobales archaeon]
MKKSFVVKCGDLCEELASRIAEEGIEFSSIEVSGGSMRITFSDDIVNPEREIEEIKRIFAELRPVSPSGVKKIDVSRIQRIIEGPIMPDVICELLRLRGYKADYDGRSIATNASYETIIDVSKKVSSCIKRLARRDLTLQAKKLVVFTCAYHEIEDPGACVETLAREGLLKLAEENLYHISSNDLSNLMRKSAEILCEETLEENSLTNESINSQSEEGFREDLMT